MFNHPKLLITCEHAGNEVPTPYAQVFASDPTVLETHRGLDIGAMALASFLAKALPSDADYANPLSRLLIDVNRSLSSADLFSKFSRRLSKPLRASLIRDYYQPYRLAVIEQLLIWQRQKATVFHLSVHSFTPVFEGKKRDMDIGILFDPKRPLEQKIATHWKAAFEETTPLKVALNQPYRGTADGFTTLLRRLFFENYAGIELETNQALWAQGKLEHHQSILKSLKIFWPQNR